MATTLDVEDARVDLDGVPAVDGLTLSARAERSLVLGAPRALFLAACGLEPVVRGRVTVLGAEPVEAARARAVAGAPFEPPLPPTWTPIEYATWSARLVGLPKADAAAAAREAAASLKLGPLATGPISRLPAHARRATVVCAALATGARLLLLEDPTGGLPEELARSFGQMLVAALADRSWVLFAPRVPLTSPVAVAAEEAMIVSASRVDAQGAPASLAAAGKRFVARVHGETDALAARLAARGVSVEVDGARLVLDLGDALTTHELLGLCTETQVVVVELSPIARALS